MTGALERLLRDRFDPVLERVMGQFVRLQLRDPVRWGLADHRRRAMERVAGDLGPRAAELGLAVVGRDPGAIERYDALVAEAVDRMRADRARSLLDAIERPLYRNVDEVMDDESFPEDERADALDVLDRLNRHAGSYDTFASIVAPLVDEAERRGRRPVRIHDCAAGHGGFAVLLKQRLGDRAVLEASDIRPEYLALGRERCRALGVEVDLFPQDALALEPLRGRGVDVITCTQSLHHFTPGMVARLIGEAARAARVGLALIDGERSWLTLALLAPVAALYGRTYAFVHDAAVSVRRMFYAEELALLAALAPCLPASARVETGAAPPAHAYVRILHEVE